MSAPSEAWGGALLAVGVASGLPLVGTIVLARRPELVSWWVPRLVFLAAGALVGGAAFHLIPEALRLASRGQTLLLVACGIAALALLERLVHAAEHRDRAVQPHATHGHSAHLMPLAIASDALHNAIDGVLIATAFIATPTLGVLAGAAIAMHELPRELGTFALCIRGGMTPRRAILVNAGTALLALAGAAITLLVESRGAHLAELLIPLAAGNFLYLAWAILWSERHTMRSSLRVQSGVLVAVGLAVTTFFTTH